MPFSLLSSALDLVFPKYCVTCGCEGDFCCADCTALLPSRHPACPGCNQWTSDAVLCGTCSEKWHIRRFYAPFPYGDARVRALLHAYKYEGLRDLAAFFGERATTWLTHYALEIPDDTLLVPMPLHRKRKAERGFNQAERFAKELAARLNREVNPLLIRTRHTAQQAKLENFEAREKNVAGTFALIPGTNVEGRRILLIDDVATSGATIAAAARVLREAGAATVSAFVIAKG